MPARPECCLAPDKSVETAQVYMHANLRLRKKRSRDPACLDQPISIHSGFLTDDQLA
jgi:hypothetical protein